MENIHVGRGLDQDQQIYRYLSFYDLIELLTFSQISFTWMDPRLPESSSAEQATGLAHQTWTLLDQEDAVDWHTADMSQPRICIISSIGALSAALLTNRTTNVYVERSYRILQGPSHAPFRLAAALPLLQDGTVSVIVDFNDDAVASSRRRGNLRMLVDLNALLLGVIVSPDASIRFLELTSKLVQQATNAFVSRASRPLETGLRGAGQQYPAYPHATEELVKLYSGA